MTSYNRDQWEKKGERFNASETNETEMKKTSARRSGYYLIFALMMLGLGASDAARGVFAPLFGVRFSLSTGQISQIIMVSYLGNLLFMLVGTGMSDRIGIRRAFLLSLFAWILSQGIYLLTDSYPALLLGVFLAMGASTLLNILLNMMSPLLFVGPATAVNSLFFIQEIGTTLTQGGVGRRADSIWTWKLLCLALLAIGLVSWLAYFRLSAGDSSLEKADRKTREGEGRDRVGAVYRRIIREGDFWLFVLIFGFYFIAEHGIMNWMNLYGRKGLGMEANRASLLPTLFFFGMMLGRLIFAPLVGRMDLRRALLLFLGGGTCFYLLSFFFLGRAYWLLFAAGLGLSVIYPTMTMCIRLYFPEDIATTAAGAIMGLATCFDILFNFSFGGLIDRVGYRLGILLLPLFIVLCLGAYLLLFVRKGGGSQELLE